MNLNIQSWKQVGNHSCITREEWDGTSWYSGEVGTPHGFVSVYSQGLDGDNPSTSYRAIYRGRYYYATEKTAHTPRGLAITAGRFMRKVVALVPPAQEDG